MKLHQVWTRTTASPKQELINLYSILVFMSPSANSSSKESKLEDIPSMCIVRREKILFIPCFSSQLEGMDVHNLLTLVTSKAQHQACMCWPKVPAKWFPVEALDGCEVPAEGNI